MKGKNAKILKDNLLDQELLWSTCSLQSAGPRARGQVSRSATAPRGGTLGTVLLTIIKMWVTQQVREEGDQNPTLISRLELAKGSPFHLEVSRVLIIISMICPWDD